MALYLARFRGTLSPLVIDEPQGLDAAIVRIEAETGERPATLESVPPGTLFTEVRFATAAGVAVVEGGHGPEAEEEEEDNPANLSPMGVILEPFEDFAEWLEARDDDELPSVLALAPTEPPAVEESPGG